jgi:UDP-N-acetylmuramate: L-alanyl-gamma-D-glutamyl-meso-diaminopimelate ligase
MTSPNARPLPSIPAIESLRVFHIIGVCGTAMGTLAVMLQQSGKTVSGSDAMAYPPMSDWLRERGIAVQSGYRAEHIPADCEIVVVGNVARADNPEAVEAQRRGLPMLSLPEVLRLLFLKDRRPLVVAGTHGKTTTTAWATRLLDIGGHDPSMFVGGVTVDYDGNFRLGSGAPFVVEGDEYDTAYFDKVPKFWHYPAYSATINNVEFDHADIYPDIRAIERVFQKFAQSVDPRGSIWVNGDDERALRVSKDSWATIRRFGLGDANDVRATINGVTAEGTHISLTVDGGAPIDGLLPTVGEYNVRNFMGAAGLASGEGMSFADSLTAAPRFGGVKKRQQRIGEKAGIVVYDDFAHHPTAVRATLKAMRERFPDRRIRVAFEVKSNTSRRRVFQDDFAIAFGDADEVVFSQPWKKDTLPESELLDLPGLVRGMQDAGAHVTLIPEVAGIVEYLASTSQQGDVILGLSGSSFGGFHQLVLDAIGD